MRNNSSTIYSFLLLVGDFVALLGAFSIAYIFRVKVDARPVANAIAAADFVVIFSFLTPIILAIFATLQLYSKATYERRISEFGRLLVGSFVGILTLIGYDFVSTKPIFPAKLVALYAFVLGFVLLLLERSLMRAIRTGLFAYGFGINKVLIVGSGASTNELINKIAQTQHTGQKVIAVIGKPSAITKRLGIPTYSSLHMIDEFELDTIIQTGNLNDETLTKELIGIAQDHHVSYRFVPEQAQLYAGNTQVELYQGVPIVTVQPTALIGWGRFVKRSFDIVVSFVLIVILSPLFLLIAIAIKLSDPGPVIFRQRRLTRFDTPFQVLKFRSLIMKYNGRDEVTVFKEMGREDLAEEFVRNRGKVVKDPRISPIGRFLRVTSLDELPQLINVLKGDISLVGPRAIVEHHAREYKENRSLMLSVKTGITGLAQVSGRDDLTLEERINLDIYYVQNWSFWLDLSILVKTAYILVVRKGFRA